MFVGWLVTLLALWVEHIALTHEPWRLGPPATYRVGVLTILGGYCLWAGLETRQTTVVEPWLAVLALIVIGPGAGVIVEVLYWYDGRRRAQRTARAAADLADDIADDIKGAIRGLRRGTDDPQSRN